MNIADLEAKIDANWADPRLLQIWLTLQTPDYTDGEAYLCESDIDKLCELVHQLNADLMARRAECTNKPS